MQKTVFAALALIAFTQLPSRAAVLYKDDLRSCSLPHGEITIPLAGSPDAVNGSLLKLADGSLAPLPGADNKPDRHALAQTIVAKHAGDLEFLPDDKGTFWATSGRIVDVGTRYLQEAAAMKLDRPSPIPGDAKHPAGLLPGVLEGRTYLLETTDGHFALLRVLAITKAGVTLQYVYQPGNGVNFPVKQADLIDVKADPTTLPAPSSDLPAVPTAPITPDPIAATTGTGGIVGSTGEPGGLVLRIGPDIPKSTVLEPYLSTHLQQRQLLIATRLKTLRAPAATPAEIDKKIEAIHDLLALHAQDAAAPVLVDQISFIDTRNEKQANEGDFQDSLLPCFAALKKMGKPASDAALKTLRIMNPDQPADNLQDSNTKARLLGLVVRAVEGDAVGEFILRRERDATTDPARRAMYNRILSSASTQPAQK